MRLEAVAEVERKRLEEEAADKARKEEEARLVEESRLAEEKRLAEEAEK